MRKITLYVILALVLCGAVLGAECGSTPISGCSITTSTTFVQDTYNLAGTASGAIDINGDDMIIDCNGSTIIGNDTVGTNGRGLVFRSGSDNVEFRDCTIQNYTEAVRLFGTNNTINNITFSGNNRSVYLASLTYENAVIKNSVFNGSYYASIFGSTPNASNLTIINNQFEEREESELEGPPYGIYLFRSTNSATIINNYFDSYTRPLFVQHYVGSGVWLIENNTFTYYNSSDGARQNTKNAEFFNTSNINFTGNFCEFGQICIRVRDLSDNVWVENNEFNNSDFTTHFTDSSNIYVRGNHFNNCTYQYDNYNLAVSMRNVTDSIIEDNTATEIGSQGIFIQACKNISVTNNSLSFVPISERDNYLAHDNGFPRACLQVTTSYRSWINDNINEQPANYSRYNSSDITISGNTCQNIDVMLYEDGTVNLSQDLTDFWHKRFWFPSTFAYPSQFWINDTFTNVTNFNFSRIPNTELGIGWRSPSPTNGNFIRYRLAQDTITLRNVNETAYSGLIYNLTSPTISGVITSPSVITDTQANITLCAGCSVEVGT